MKAVHALLIIMLIYAIKADNVQGFGETLNCVDYAPTNRGGSKQAYSLDFCKATYLDSNYKKCCFIKYKIGDAKHYNCFPATSGDLIDIDDTIDKLTYDKVYSLDCNSNYLFVSLLAILALLF